ncbi:hypothetical protein A9Q99_04195 [Gammaproteobacteria bacterium 45_16_T64]|nr:hypothetical protein A9Q99_04195 [Gammaproteobacteria bacterium 45_16_T64]
MTSSERSHSLFISAFKEAVRQYPRYFSYEDILDDIDSRWDIHPDYAQLEHLLLEEDSTKHFIFNVWSFFSPISAEKNGLAEMIRPMLDWQKDIICQLILNDNIT